MEDALYSFFQVFCAGIVARHARTPPANLLETSFSVHNLWLTGRAWE